MAVHEITTRTVPAQPSRRLHKGDLVITLQEMLEHCMPTARPLMSLAELRAEEEALLTVDEVLDRIRQRRQEVQ